jgi:hypothetical protein
MELVWSMIASAVRETDSQPTYPSVVEATSAPPDRASREVISRTMKDFSARFQAAAYVALRTGTFRILPPIVNVCAILARVRMDVRFFSREEAVLAWLSRRAPTTESFQRLLAHAVEAKRSGAEAELQAV